MADTIYYIAVGRDDAKQLFGTKDPVALRTLITDWIQSPGIGDRLLQVGEAWLELREHLQVPREEMQLAVTSMFEGNRRLLDEDGLRVSLVRPDAAGAVVHFLNEVDSVGPNAAGAIQAGLKKFFATALEAREAIAIVHSGEAISK